MSKLIRNFNELYLPHCLLTVSVDFGRAAARPCQCKASQEENKNSQQHWKENDSEGELVETFRLV